MRRSCFWSTTTERLQLLGFVSASAGLREKISAVTFLVKKNWIQSSWVKIFLDFKISLLLSVSAVERYHIWTAYVLVWMLFFQVRILSKLYQFLRVTADSLVVFSLYMSKTQVLAKSSLKVWQHVLLQNENEMTKESFWQKCHHTNCRCNIVRIEALIKEWLTALRLTSPHRQFWSSLSKYRQ